MVQDADRIGGYSVSDEDGRVTRFGRFLRKTHIDELPNLINVLRGEMVLFGPRPDVPWYANRIPEPERSIIFSVKPGCIDPATLWNLDEGKKLSGKEDPEKYYEEVIWPQKIRKQVNYIGKCYGYGFLRKALSLVFSVER
jgi:lipopolysaccharide/colanic/teichoic acid biosynthesis glycosyltransferase